ncbi:MAG: hypothetical protein DI566_07740 [Microbacterium sp.]|nr:MAG: hypothetical protein DI566_07740 [Microbacterium sp.]
MPNTASEPSAPVESRVDDPRPQYLQSLRRTGAYENASPSFQRAVDILTMDHRRSAQECDYFLTVVLRTQGRRPETLKDSLLCLMGQTDEDFEVIVACHDIADADFAVVTGVIESQPPSFRERVRVMRVHGGLRARPLNKAVREARGSYLSFFDDDDLVFGHWVESFAKAARTAPGRLVRARVAAQHAKPELWPSDQDGFRHVSWPSAEYPRHFDQLAHLRMNYSPFMGWAFPRQLFFTLGELFDEELFVCEDWDLILRGSLLCGVVEADNLTAIYRRWDGVESSYTAHDMIQWEASQARVITKLDERSIIVPGGTVSRLRALLDERDQLAQIRDHHHAIMASRGYRYSAPVREAMRVADFGRRALRRLKRRPR